MATIATALCTVCLCEDEGIDLTPQRIKELRAVRLGGNVLSEFTATMEHAQDPMAAIADNPDDAMPGRRGYWVKAVTRIRVVVGAAIEAAKEAIPQSKQIAKEKRRRRIFEQPLDDPDVKQDKEV